MPNRTFAEDQSTLTEPQTTAEKKVRVQLDFEPTDMRIINDLVSELALGTRAELFRSALRSLRWMVQKKREESSIIAITKDGRYVEPQFDFLDRFLNSGSSEHPSARNPVRGDFSDAVSAGKKIHD